MNDVSAKDARAQSCDECGKFPTAIHRVHKNHRYCQTCYARVFKRRLCPSCKTFKLLPKTDARAICLSCQSKKPCVRCKRIGRPIGKLIDLGPVCNSCAPYFNEPKPCESCGELSKTLTRVHRHGTGLKVCKKCARSDHGNCQMCRRSRLLSEYSDGRGSICEKCRTHGYWPCEQCGAATPAGYGKRCESCAWKHSFSTRRTMYAKFLSRKNSKTLWFDFCDWLESSGRYQSSAIKLKNYLHFFEEVDKNWASLPSYRTLVKHFGAEGLRRMRKVNEWLAEATYVDVDPVARELDSDTKRVEKLVGQFTEGSAEYRLMDGYLQVQQAKLAAGKTTMRSVRLAMSPAAKLIEKASDEQRLPPTQECVNRLLSDKPGQRNALSGFVSYLNSAHSAALTLPERASSKSVSDDRPILRKRLLALCQNPNWTALDRQWLSLALAYFHDLPLSAGKAVKLEKITICKDGNATVHWRGQDYLLPNPQNYDDNASQDA